MASYRDIPSQRGCRRAPRLAYNSGSRRATKREVPYARTGAEVHIPWHFRATTRRP